MHWKTKMKIIQKPVIGFRHNPFHHQHVVLVHFCYYWQSISKPNSKKINKKHFTFINIIDMFFKLKSKHVRNSFSSHAL